MRLGNVKIGTQLQIGLGTIIILVALLGMAAWNQSNTLWQATQDLHDHPLVVRRALENLTGDILQINWGTEALLLADSDAERAQTLEIIDTYEADAFKQLDILYATYLGPRRDIDDVYHTLQASSVQREAMVRLWEPGSAAAVIADRKSIGFAGEHIDAVMDEIRVISDFAQAKGDEVYGAAQVESRSLALRLQIVLAVILLVSFSVGYLLWRGIKGPLTELTLVTAQYRRGDLDARSRYASANEFGMLSAAFNALAGSVQSELQAQENTIRVAEVLREEASLYDFCRETLKVLLEFTGLQVGAVYLLNAQKIAFEHLVSIGLGTGARAAFSALEHKGEFGVALATGQIQRITDIPPASRFAFRTVSGEFQPCDIITIPILSGRETVAMISLAGIRCCDASAMRLINDVWGVLTARLNSVLLLQQVRESAEKLEHQNRELDAQRQALALQSNELREQNIELEVQKTQLGEANRLKSTFLSNMSHELRTPLNSVIALAGVLGRRLHGAIPEEEHGYLDVIERNGRHLLELINDVLDLSRIEAGKAEVSVSRFSISQVVGEVLDVIAPQEAAQGISLISHVDDALPLITSDSSLCRHILLNIVGNAVKFTAEGSVEVSATVTEDEVRIAVADTGIGIAPDQLDYIFDEFRQADESTSRIYGGTGLGLSIARKYAALLEGSIVVESVLGEGSTFTLRLPVTPAAGSVDASDAGGVAAPASGVSRVAPRQGRMPRNHVPSILVVEDSEPAIIQITDMLVTQGYRVQVAHNGSEALDAVAKALPDAVILDLMMPGVDGFQVLRAIRGVDVTALLPVLILTAKHVTREELSFLKGNHIHQVIQKGAVNKQRLLAAIREMLPAQTLDLSDLQETPQSPPSRSSGDGKPVILIVEDNPDNMLTARALLGESYTLLEATDGEAGVAQARIHHPALILMDISLPLLDGIDALAVLRQDATLKDIPVIAVTASAMKGNREEILARGFDAYVSKPIDRQLLEHTIKEKLHGRT